MPDVPFLCHLERAVGMTGQEPYEEIFRYLSIMRHKVATVFTTLSNFDAVNLAKRVTVGTPALFSTGEMDMTCPPSTVFAARNWWGRTDASQTGDAPEIVVYPFNQHEGGQIVKGASSSRGCAHCSTSHRHRARHASRLPALIQRRMGLSQDGVNRSPSHQVSLVNKTFLTTFEFGNEVAARFLQR